MGWALILTLMAIFLIARESFTRWSFGSSPVRDIICLLGRQLEIRWTTPFPCATQFLLQLINLTLHVSFILWMEDMTLPSWLTLASMRCMCTSFMISPLLRVYTWIVMLRTPDFARCGSTLSWGGPIVDWCELDSSISNAKPKSHLDQIKLFPQTAPIIRTNFGLDPKQDWVLAQQAQTINL